MTGGVFAVGGTHGLTQVVLAAGALVIAVVHVILGRGLRRVPFTSVALLGVGLSLFQLVPLPSAVVRFLSPHAFELRGEVTAAAPALLPLTLDVPATVLEVSKGLMCTAVLVIVGRAAARGRVVRLLLTGVSLLGVSLVVIAAIQRALHTDMILGIYRARSLPGSFVFGTFVNGNHAASVLTLSVLASLGLALAASGSGRLLFAAASAVSASGLLFTSSRGGAVSCIFGGFLLALALLTRRYGRWRGMLLALGIAVAASFAVLALAEGIRSRFFRGDGSHLWDNQKTRGWSAALRMVRDYPLAGVGRGAFEAPASSYRVDTEGVRLVYPENLPLQLATEWGVPGALGVMVLFAVVAGRIARRVPRQEPPVVAAACGVVAVLLHEFVDFGLEMPGVALPAMVMLGVVVGRVTGGRTGGSEPRLPRLGKPALAAVGGIWAVSLVAGAWAAERTLTPDGDRALAAATGNSPSAASVIDAARARHPADYYLELLAATHDMNTGTPAVLHHLNRALRLNPSSGETHAITARWLARLRYRAQAALEFRLAREHGVSVGFDEIFAAVGTAAVEAVPQKSDVLVSLSQYLSARGHADAADAAARRAVEQPGSSDEMLTNVLDIAMATGEAPRMIQAAKYVLANNPGTVAVLGAARAYYRAGEKATAVRTIDHAIAHAPEDPTALLLSAAKLRLEFGDAAGARELLSRNSAAQQRFHLADMVELQKILADIADTLGDSDAAVIARARGRMFSRRLAESQVPVELLRTTPPAP